MVTTARRMTAEDLAEMPDDGFRYELIRGELKRMAPAGRFHGRSAAKLCWSLMGHVEALGLGEVYAAETGFRLAADHVLAPDASFISNEKVALIGDADGYLPCAPDLAIEVISPNDRYAEVERKTADWLDAGTRAVVVVDRRRRTISVHRSQTDVAIFTETDTTEIDDVIPGWRMPVRDVYE